MAKAQASLETVRKLKSLVELPKSRAKLTLEKDEMALKHFQRPPNRLSPLSEEKTSDSGLKELFPSKEHAKHFGLEILC